MLDEYPLNQKENSIERPQDMSCTIDLSDQLLRNNISRKMNVAKMRMFRWLSGNIVMTEYKIEIYSKLEVASVVSKMRESCRMVSSSTKQMHK